MSEQLELDVVPEVADVVSESRTYWENRGLRDWRPVTVRVRYGDVAGDPEPLLPHVRTVRLAPRNVLVERDDGTRAVKPVRLLRVECPR